MSFRVWFRQWIGSFCKLLTVGTKKRKSEAQRKKERERRLKAKYSSANYYRIKKKRRRRRSSHSVQNKRLIGALFKFMATSLGVLLLPFGLLDWGRKSAKSRKASRGGSPRALKKASQNQKTKNTPKSTIPKSGTATANTLNNKMTSQHSDTAVKVTVSHTNTKQQERFCSTPIRLFEHPEPKMSQVVEPSVLTEPDENTPKSMPKNEKDQYIRKRMIIAGSYYCDKAVLDVLKVGSYIDIEAEPDNPYDKDAVKLLHNGQKIGYIAKKDHLAFVTCLKLKRNIYGVITAIIEEKGQTKYEYETWFDSTR